MNFAQDAPFRSLLAVVEVKQPVVFELWMKGEREQSFLVLDLWFSRSQIQERLWVFSAGVAREQKHFPVLFDNNYSLRVVRYFFHPKWPIEFQAGKSDRQTQRRNLLSGTSGLENDRERNNQL